MLDKKIKKQLVDAVDKSRVDDDPISLKSYSYDGYVVEALPDAVIFPLTTDEVAKIVAVAQQHRIPIVARGGGSNLTGGTTPIEGGIVLNFTKMNKILEINTGDRFVVVQPGVINSDLQRKLAKYNYFFPPDPSSMGFSTIGGNVAENAGGPRCLKYGVTVDYILGMEVVLAGGKVARFGSCNIKDVTGYRLAGLFCGSEGTLGLVTEVTLRIVPLPEAYRTMLFYYRDLAQTADVVKAVIAKGIVPTAMELMDHTSINLVEDATHLGLEREAEGVLLVEVDGPGEAVDRQAAEISKIAKDCGAFKSIMAKSEQEREALWTARRSLHGILSRLAPNCVTEDATVPVSNLPAMIKGVRDILTRHQITAGIVAHAGDGNMHPVITTDVRDKEEWARVELAAEEIFELAISLRGTLSGEHGIGIAKKRYLPMLMDEHSRELMKDIKRALDPDNILNPGKYFA